MKPGFNPPLSQTHIQHQQQQLHPQYPPGSQQPAFPFNPNQQPQMQPNAYPQQPPPPGQPNPSMRPPPQMMQGGPQPPYPGQPPVNQQAPQRPPMQTQQPPAMQHPNPGGQFPPQMRPLPPNQQNPPQFGQTAPPMTNQFQPAPPRPAAMNPAHPPTMNQGFSRPPAAPQTGAGSPPHSPSAAPGQGSSPTSQTGQHSRRKLYPDEIKSAYNQPAASVDPFSGGSFQPSPVSNPSQRFPGPSSINNYGPTSSNVPSSHSTSNLDPSSAMGNAGGPQQLNLYPKSSSYSSLSGSSHDLNQSFGNLTLANAVISPAQPVQTLSLSNSPTNPYDPVMPPPMIRLSPQAAVTQSSFANCNPEDKRCTMNMIPQTSAILNKTRVPLGLIISPFRTLNPGEEEIPVISTQTIVRCRRCRTYINPYVQFMDQGARWKCNLCYLVNEVPESFDYDMQSQQYIDRYKRPELTHAVVEFVAPAEYMVRPPQPAVYLFIIDVSYQAVQSGMVAVAAQTLLDSLDKIPNQDKRTKFALITVDSSLHFYSLTPDSTEPNMLVVADLDDPFLPKPDDLLVNLDECKNSIKSLLEKIPAIFQNNANVGNALGSALQAAFKLISPIGGKIAVLQASLPNTSVGALKQREDVKTVNSKVDMSLLQPASPFYKQFAVDCSRSQVSVDMFLFGTGYIDVATLSTCPRFTGGSTYYYPNFNAGRREDAVKFSNEFRHFVGRDIALEAVMRVRASKGIKLSSFHGNFFIRSSDLLALPNVNPDNTYAIEMQIEETIQSSVVCFQTALLHTTSFGERRIRVLTLALPVSNSLVDLYQSIDQVALMNLLARKAIDKALTSKMEDARDALLNKIIDLCGVYRTCLGSIGGGAAGGLVVSENWRGVAVMTLGLIKHMALRASMGIPSDTRSFYMELLRVLSADLTATHIHPVFHSLHNMSPEVGLPGASGQIVLPPLLPLSSERLERNGIYLIFDGLNLFLWISRNVEVRALVELFGTDRYENLPVGKTTLPPPTSEFSSRVHNIIGKHRQNSLRKSTTYPYLYLIKEDNTTNQPGGGGPDSSPVGLRMWFLSLLIEDRMQEHESYAQWIAKIKDGVSKGSF